MPIGLGSRSGFGLPIEEFMVCAFINQKGSRHHVAVCLDSATWAKQTDCDSPAMLPYAVVVPGGGLRDRCEGSC